MSFEAVPEDSQNWSWGDVGRLPEAIPARLPAVDSHVRQLTSCEDDDDRRRRRLESATRWM